MRAKSILFLMVANYSAILLLTSCKRAPSPPALQSPANFSWFWYSDNLQIEFKWLENNGDNEYILQIDEIESFLTPLMSIGVSGTDYTWSSPARGYYYWRVYPKGWSESSSDTFEFEIGPYVINQFSTGGDIPYASATYIYFGECYLLLACESGLRIINAGIFGTNPQLVSYIPTTDIASDVDIKEHYAFVAAGTDGLKIINIENPSNPQVIGEVAIPGYYGASSVEISSYAYDWNVYVGSDNGLYVVDCSILSQPQIIANIPVDSVGFIFDMAVYGDYVFAASNMWGYGQQGLYAIDVSDPYHPRKIAYHYSEGTGMAVYADYGKIWFASLPHKLEILNTLPLFQLLGEFELEHPPVDGSISLSFPSEICFVGTDEGLEVIDATDPANCSKISSIEFPYVTTSVSTITGGDVGFITNTIDGLYIIKIKTLTMNY